MKYKYYKGEEAQEKNYFINFIIWRQNMIEQKQVSFAWKSGLILFGFIALFIGLGIIGGLI